MKIPHDKFCVLPWVSLETSPIGTVRPCCLAEEEIVDNAGNKFELRSANLGVVQNSKYMINLRQEFLDDKRPRTCRKCWNEERAGRTSKRLHTLNRLKHMIQDDTWTVDAKPLMFLDLKLGNICNLKCRICGAWSSSTFATEELNFIGTEESRKSSFQYKMLKNGAWPRDNEQFWDQIDKIVDQIQYIEFTGGEPFMIQEHFTMLQGIVDRGIAGQVEIHYNTNGTQFPLRGPDIWKHFKTVEIAFSIDDVGARFEYQRTGAKWDLVNENIQKFKAMQKSMPNLQLQCCSTINVFNVMYLEDLATWHAQTQFDFVFWNMMHEAYYFNIGTLPESAKELATQRLQQASVDEKTQQEFNLVIDFMQKGVSLDGNILRMKIKDFDWKRKEDLRTHHAELAAAVNYEGP